MKRYSQYVQCAYYDNCQVLKLIFNSPDSSFNDNVHVVCTLCILYRELYSIRGLYTPKGVYKPVLVLNYASCIVLFVYLVEAETIYFEMSTTTYCRNWLLSAARC